MATNVQSASFGKLGYLMFAKESTVATAVYPTTPIELLSFKFTNPWKTAPVDTVAGLRDKYLRTVQDKVGPFTATVEMYVEANEFPNFLQMALGQSVDSALSGTAVYQHAFTSGTISIPTYTIDIRLGGEPFCERLIGCMVSKAAFKIENNILKVTLTLMAQKVFTNARVTTAASSGTSLLVDQTTGLTTSDSIGIYSGAIGSEGTLIETLTISAIVSETALTVSTIGSSLPANAIIALTNETITPANYNQGKEFNFSGGCTVSLQAAENAFQNLVSKTNAETFELTITNEMETKWAASGVNVVNRMPSALLLKDVLVETKFSQFLASEGFMDKLRSATPLGFRFQFNNQAAIATASAVSATATLNSSGAGTVTTTVSAAGLAGDDYAIIVVQGSGALSCTLVNKLITVTLSSTASNNAVATVATAISALTGLSATSSSSGNVSTTANPNKIMFNGGMDANPTPMLRFDLPYVVVQPFNPNIDNKAIIMEDITLMGFYDFTDLRQLFAEVINGTATY